MSRPHIFTTPCMYLDINGLQEAVKLAVPEVTAVFRKDDEIVVHSVGELTQEQKDLVNSTKMAFADSDPSDKTPLIYDIAKAEAKGKHFHNIDYKKELSVALIPERESGTYKGEIREVIWYKDMDMSDPANPTPVNPIIRTNIQYFRDSTGFALYRITDRTYFNRDGSENSEVKSTMKYYHVNKQDMIDEGVKRRSLLVKSIQIPTMNLIAEVLMPLGVTMENVVLKGREFMDDYETLFSKFIENSSSINDPLNPDFGEKSVIVALRDEARAGHVEWLDKIPNSLGGSTSIRQHLIEEFSI